MAKVVNLRLARKAAQRDAHRKTGDENAARHGMSHAERQQQADDAGRAARHLDGHQIDRDDAGRDDD